MPHIIQLDICVDYTYRTAFNVSPIIRNQILAFIAFSLIILFFKFVDNEPIPFSNRLSHVDFLGTAILVSATVTFLLATTWAASGTIQWSSGAVVGLYHAAAICVALFLFVERSALLPIVSLHIIEERSLIAILIMSVTIGFGWNGFFEHVPLFMQVSLQELTLAISIKTWIHSCFFIRLSLPLIFPVHYRFSTRRVL